MRKILSLFIISLFILPFSLKDSDAQSLKIAAIVNEDVITVYDLQNRMRFLIFSTQAQPDQAALKRIRSQALRALIDEKLKIQSAKESNITIAPSQIDKEISKLEARNNLPKGQLPVLLKTNNIDAQTLRDRVTADLSWGRFVSRNLRRNVRITEDLVDDELDNIATQQNQSQKRIFEIYLPFDGAELESDTRALALELKKELEEGSTFTTIARNYSKSNSAQLGGDRGWLSPGQLPEELDSKVQALKIGQISDPIETLTGLFLFQVTDERNLAGDIGKTELGLVQLGAPTTSTSRDVVLGQMNALKSQINSCEAAVKLAESNADISSTQTSKILLRDLSETVQAQVKDLKVNQSTSPIPVQNAVILLTVCTRKEPQSNLPSRRDIRKQLFNAKLDILARQRLRDLRNAAFIDIRN
ncbi:peptidylprolyl isomerase [Curvivirga sp.]|uniref:peptidylprolyl isomerase n=1 Tax=Curvivirga sp. TaxID=2856848 RepID=UPI003B591B2A